jgi:hypothetical protein
MPISTIVKNKRDGTLTLLDSGGSNSVVVAYEVGDLSITIPGPTIESYLDRGSFASTPSLRLGDDQPMTFTFSAYMRDVSDASYITLESILCSSGVFSSTWVSTLGSSADVKTVTTRWDIEGTNHGDSADHRIEMNYCFVNGSIGEGGPNTVNVAGTAFDLYPTVT